MYFSLRLLISAPLVRCIAANFVFVGGIVGLLLAGCEAGRDATPARDRAPAAEQKSEMESRSRDALISDALGRGKFASVESAAELPQRVIYEAEVTLVVDDVSKIERELTNLLDKHGGHVAEAAIDRTQGEQLSGRWRVRVPVQHFDSFLEAVSKLGTAESRRQTAQDVTEEFVDLEARIANKKRLEERILELLKTSGGAIKDVIEVERELARVRGEIEQMEGRLRYLTSRTELTTVTIVAREERDYVPPKAPTFATRIQRAWSGSLMSLLSFGERVVIASVAAFPWIVVICLAAVPLWFVGKRFRR